MHARVRRPNERSYVGGGNTCPGRPVRPTFLSSPSAIDLSRRSNAQVSCFGLLLIGAFGHCGALIGAFPESGPTAARHPNFYA